MYIQIQYRLHVEHALGHINALARTFVSLEAFILMAANSPHLGGDFRPPEAAPLPLSADIPGLVPHPSPPDFTFANKDIQNVPQLPPFLGLDLTLSSTSGRYRVYYCITSIIRRGHERVFVVFAHDVSILDISRFLPEDCR